VVGNKGFIKFVIILFMVLLGLGFCVHMCKGDKHIPKREGTHETSQSWNDLEKLAKEYISLQEELKRNKNKCDPMLNKDNIDGKCRLFNIPDIERELQDVSLKLRAYKYEDVQYMFSKIERKR
jgi:hypothetical protein